MNRVIAFLISLIFAGYFIWIWRDAGKTGVINDRRGTWVERAKRPTLFQVLRWLYLGGAATLVGFGLYFLVAQP
jgi:hypothetical protein